MRRVCLAVGLTAVFLICTISASFAAATAQKAKASIRAKAETASATEAGGTPPNCIRESCGRLWCWHMRGEASKR